MFWKIIWNLCKLNTTNVSILVVWWNALEDCNSNHHQILNEVSILVVWWNALEVNNGNLSLPYNAGFNPSCLMECSGSIWRKQNHKSTGSFNPSCLMECSGRVWTLFGGRRLRSFNPNCLMECFGRLLGHFKRT